MYQKPARGENRRLRFRDHRISVYRLFRDSRYLPCVKEQLRKLTSDSAVYGVSNILGRFITFLLVPFYTQFLPQGEYGIVIVMYSFIAFLNGVFTFGLEPAYMRFVTGKSEHERNRVFATSILFIAAAAVVLMALVMLFRSPVQGLLELRPEWNAILPLSLGMIALDAVNVIPFAALRMENRARVFAAVKLTSIVINVALNVLFIAIMRESIVFIFISGVIASASSTVLLLPFMASRLRAGTDRELLVRLLAYGLPTMPGAVAIMLIEIIDKPIMLKLTDAATAGVYGTNYKLGIFMMLVVTVFRYAWQPFYLQLSATDDSERSAGRAGEKKGGDESKRLFARVLTYFVLLGAVVVLTLSLFIDELVRIPIPFTDGRRLIHPAYWGGLGIVPIILFSYLWAGIAQILNAGLYIEKRTSWILYATAAGAAVNILINILFIPLWGMYGGAAATFAAYVVICLIYAAAGRRIYPIRWEYGRLARIGLALTASALCWYLVPAPDLLGSIAWEVLILFGFGAILSLSGFFQPAEIRELRAFLSFRRS